ncbi:MAG: cysteine desulfurase [Chitinophagia bacterium]|nr:cysteine desulfurase [Chitinophagia bacterium]
MPDRIYLDNAATTSLDPAVLAAMMPYLTERFGNPSSIYSYGRETRLAVETARKSVARILNTRPATIFFTSGGTESSNTAICGAVRDLGCRRIVTSPVEHHATLHTVENLQRRGEAVVEHVRLRPDGHIDLADLDRILVNGDGPALVTLMHANNEVGNLTDIRAVGEICRRHGAYFHSDTVQTVGHFPIDLQDLPVDFITGSGHKFHGPKGSGILYVREGIALSPFLQGGGQERNMRAGTENLYGIVGFARALELATERYEEDRAHVTSLKRSLMEGLRRSVDGVRFHGDPEGESLYTVLNVSLPRTERSEMILYNLDMAGVCVSGGSACTSGANQGSHVIRAIYGDEGGVAVRFSFCRHNTPEEVDRVVEQVRSLA